MTDAEKAAKREQRFEAEIGEAATITDAEFRKRTRRSFIGLGAAAAASYVGFRALQNSAETANIASPLRKGLETNEAVWDAIGSDSRLSRTFDVSDREEIRVNGRIGLSEEFDPSTWSLSVVGVDGEQIESLDLAAIQSLGRESMVWEHKCVEGWSNIVHWTGARFSDLAARYYADGSVPKDHKYVSLRTPDQEYYVGLDRSLVLHPQTLLAWGLNGEPLSLGHGAPLRLATPAVYGIKQLKRVGTIEFTNTRPPDYWAARGYDWHARF